MARTHASETLRPRLPRAERRPRARLDHATVLGLVSGFGLLFGAMALGGAPGAFIDLRSVLIVVGGTLGVSAMCFSFADLARAPAVIVKTLVRSIPDARETALDMLRLAELARTRGLLELDGTLADFGGQRFVQSALATAVDGMKVDEIERILRRDIDEMVRRHGRSASLLRKAAEVAPAMGLIGTLVGLVQMLGNLEDPSTIGPSMAVALLTTFYGAVLATMVFSPLAAKLERNSDEETLVANISMLTAQSICRKENPRRLEMLFNAMLPPDRRIRFFE